MQIRTGFDRCGTKASFNETDQSITFRNCLHAPGQTHHGLRIGKDLHIDFQCRFENRGVITGEDDHQTELVTFGTEGVMNIGMRLNIYQNPALNPSKR